MWLVRKKEMITTSRLCFIWMKFLVTNSFNKIIHGEILLNNGSVGKRLLYLVLDKKNGILRKKEREREKEYYE